MDTQTKVTYQIASTFTDERFVVDEEYEALYYYKKRYLVTEIHTTVAMLPPLSKVLLQVTKNWHDKDPEYINPEPDEV